VAEPSLIAKPLLCWRPFHVERDAFSVAFLEGGFQLVLVENANWYTIAPLLSFLNGRGFLLPILAPVFDYRIPTWRFFELVESTLGFALGIFAVFTSVPVLGCYVILGWAWLQALNESHTFVLNTCLDDVLEVAHIVSV